MVSVAGRPLHGITITFCACVGFFTMLNLVMIFNALLKIKICLQPFIIRMHISEAKLYRWNHKNSKYFTKYLTKLHAGANKKVKEQILSVIRIYNVLRDSFQPHYSSSLFIRV
jgi:hypothetical protein